MCIRDSGEFARQIEAQFEGGHRIRYHLAPPLFARRDPHTGHLQKRSYGPWMGLPLRLLAKLRPLRGTIFDPFGYTRESRAERRLIGEYERAMEKILVLLTPENHGLALEFAQLPGRMRGYGHVKAQNVAVAKRRGAEILSAMAVS